MGNCVDFDIFLAWAEDNFDNDVSVSGTEIKLNSIFAEGDTGHHLWCSPSGGRHQRPHGVFRCWKTGRTGTLAKLVSMMDGITYNEACEMLGVNSIRLENLNEDVAELFDDEIIDSATIRSSTIELPEGVVKLTDIPKGSKIRYAAEVYLKTRKLDPNLFWVGVEGKFKGYIVIPYFDKKGDLVYFTSRKYFGKGPRYLGPGDDGNGPPKTNWLFFPEWGKINEKVYLTEGEINAIVLHGAGFTSAASGGKSLSDKQIEILSDYKPVVCYDGDKYGLTATADVCDDMLRAGITDIEYCNPPEIKSLDDWNKMLVSKGSNYIRAYIDRRTKPYTYEVGAMLRQFAVK